ncbi:hypothetical protein SAMN04487761_13020 [Lachnospiraceae bacterium C7]|nr:hypothetical protein SAMN04487761_13020 [Lachnospiraceae bacterium C7]
MENRRSSRVPKKVNRKYSVDGNAVRKTNAVPSRREEEWKKEREERRRRRARRNAARRNREKSMFMSATYVAFLSICIALGTIFTTMYILEQVKINSNKAKTSQLSSQLNELKVENDEKVKEIDSAVDLDHIKDVAMNQLGMKYARKDQVVYYSVESSNYMNQYNSIPEK